MARNPLYPRSAGETAVDKLLNQTLPQIIAGREARNERDAQRAENKRRYDENITATAKREQEQRSLYVSSNADDINTLIATGDTKGIEARIENLDKYATEYNITTFNKQDLLNTLSNSNTDYDKLSEYRINFNAASTADEVAVALEDLDSLADDSKYITEKDIVFAYDLIRQSPEKKIYSGFSNNFNPEESKKRRLQFSGYRQSQSDDVLGVTEQAITDHINELQEKYVDEQTVAGNFKASQVIKFNPSDENQRNLARTFLYNSVEEKVKLNNEAFRNQFLADHGDNVTEYFENRGLSVKFDANGVAIPLDRALQVEKDHIDKSGFTAAVIDVFGIEKGKEFNNDPSKLTASQKLEVAQRMVTGYTFPQSYADAAKKNLDEFEASELEKKQTKDEKEKNNKIIQDKKIEDARIAALPETRLANFEVLVDKARKKGFNNLNESERRQYKEYAAEFKGEAAVDALKRKRRNNEVIEESALVMDENANRSQARIDRLQEVLDFGNQSVDFNGVVTFSSPSGTRFPIKNETEEEINKKIKMHKRSLEQFRKTAAKRRSNLTK